MRTPEINRKRFELARRCVYVVIALAVIIPYFFNPKQEFKPMAEVVSVYEKIDAMKPGDQVLMAFDYDPSSEAELYPMSMALLRHCFKKGVIPVIVTHWFAGLGLFEKACNEAAEDANSMWGKKIVSGRDYALLGFRPGWTDLIVKIERDLKGAYETDYFKQPTRGMKALEGVNSLEDFELMIDLAAGATVEFWIAYGTDKSGTPMAAGTTAVSAPDLYPFYKSGQMIGFMGGLRGAADYEKLLKIPDRGERGMLAQSAAHIIIILLVLGANVHMFAKRLFGNKRD